MIAQVKDNQPALLAAVQQVESDNQPFERVCQVEQARNRIERREVRVFDAAPVLADLPESSGWPERLAAVIRVQQRHRRFFLTVQRVEGVQTALQLQFLDQLLGHGNLIGLGRHRQMAENQMLTLTEGAEDLRRFLILKSVETPPQDLAVHGHSAGGVSASARESSNRWL